MRIFVTVVAKGSFSAAANLLNVPVSTVSRRVSDLETSLGVRLLERSTRSLRLTEAGTVLYEFASRGLEEIEAGLLALAEQDSELKGRLRMTMPPDFEPMWQVLADFQRQYPQIEMDLYISERKMDFIEDGIDVAVRVGEVANQSAIARCVIAYRHRVVASPEFLRRYGTPTKPADIEGMRCAAWGKSGEPVLWRMGDEEVNIHSYLRVNDFSYMRYLALQHQCVTELPAYFCAEHIKRGELVELLPEFPLPELQASIVYPSRKQLSRITRLFIDYCVVELPRQAIW